MIVENSSLILSIVWLTLVGVAWYLAVFKEYDKVWSEGIIKFQSDYAFANWHRSIIKELNSPLMIKVYLTIFLLVGFFAIYLAIVDELKF